MLVRSPTKRRGDVISENPFWLIAALLLGIAFWHSTLARGASSHVKRRGGFCFVRSFHKLSQILRAGGCVGGLLEDEVLYIYISLDYKFGLCFLFLLLSWVDLDCLFVCLFVCFF